MTRLRHSAAARFNPPTTADPILLALDEAIGASGRGRKEVSRAAGMHEHAVRNWMIHDVEPNVNGVEAALSQVGLALQVEVLSAPSDFIPRVGRHIHTGSRAGRNLLTDHRDAHWLVMHGRAVCTEHNISLLASADAAGLKFYRCKAWWTPTRPGCINRPRLLAIRQWLEALGMRLIVVPIALAKAA